MTLPKVSVCIPCYKQPDSLRRALRSVFDQSFQNYEIIITDDSPDDCIENTVKEFQDRSKLHYFRNVQRKGSPENWNESIKHAKGEYIKILHHDDWFSNNDSLYKFVKMLEDNPAADFAFCSSTAYGPDGKPLFVHKPSKKQLSKLERDPDFLFPENFIGAPSATIFKKGVNKLFDAKIKYVVDIDFYIRVLRENQVFAFTNESLVCITSGSADQVTYECTNDRNLQIYEWLYLFKKMNQERPSFRQIRFIWGLLRKYCIISESQISAAGIEQPFPSPITFLLSCSRLMPIIRRNVGCK